MNFVFILLVNVIWAVNGFTQDYDLGKIVVESGRMNESWLETSASTLVIPASIVETEDRFLKALAAGGVEVIRSGANGNASLHLRGLPSRHTIVMIDGFPINDISNPAGVFNASYLKNLNIERIEVLRGPQSVLHSGALGGVINIITKKRADENQARVGFGNYEYKNIGVSVSNDYKKVIYHATADYEELDGLSAARGGNEEDDFHNLTTSLSAMYDLNSNIYGRTLLTYNQVTEDLDGGAFTDNSTDHAKSKQILIAQRFEFSLNKNLKNETDLSLNHNNRVYEGSFADDIDGDSFRIETRFIKSFSQSKLLFGITAIENQMKSNTLERKINQLDFFFKYNYQVGPYGGEVGARHVTHQKFGNITLYQASLYRGLLDWKIGINTGSSFRSPSISELYGSGGNTELDPEYAKSVDFFIRKKFSSGHINISFFDQEIDESIEYLSVSPYTGFNSGSYQAKGAQLEVSTQHGHFQNYLSTTYNDLNGPNGKRPFRRAYFRLTNFLSYQFALTHLVGLKYRYVGERNDSNNQKMSSYNLWDLTFEKQFADYRLNFAVNNIFNQDYEEVAGYSVLRRNYQINFNWLF